MKIEEYLPQKYRNALDSLLKFYSAKTLRPPTLIKGHYGTGKSWLLQLVYHEFKRRSDETLVLPLFLPLQLNADGLLNSISTEMESAASKFLSSSMSEKQLPSKIRYMIFIENIDRLYNLPTPGGVFSRPKRIGRGKSQYSQMQYASELRRFLIENTGRVSLFASSGKETPFTEDPGQPFYEFFNVVKIEGAIECGEHRLFSESFKKRQRCY